MGGPTIVDAIKSWLAVKDVFSRYDSDCTDVSAGEQEQCDSMKTDRDEFLRDAVASSLYRLVSGLGGFGPTMQPGPASCGTDGKPVPGEEESTGRLCEDPSTLPNGAGGFKTCIDGILDRADGAVDSEFIGASELTAVKDKVKEVIDAVDTLKGTRKTLAEAKATYSKAKGVDRPVASAGLKRADEAVTLAVEDLKDLIREIEGGKKVTGKDAKGKDVIETIPGLLPTFHEVEGLVLNSEAKRLLSDIGAIVKFARSQLGGGGGQGGGVCTGAIDPNTGKCIK